MRSTLQWFKKKAGSFGDDAGPMSPPIQTWTRLCRFGAIELGNVRHPSRVFRNPSTLTSHGARSYCLKDRERATSAAIQTRGRLEIVCVAASRRPPIGR